MWPLDTSVCVPLINRSDEQAAARLLQQPRGSAHHCSVVKAELHLGARNSSRPAETLHRAETLCRAFESLAFDDESARHTEPRGHSFAGKEGPLAETIS